MNIIEPTLILDSKKCKSNIRSFSRKAAGSNVIFRPHFKTHNSQKIGRWFREAGVDKITVSSVNMARYFAEDGWDDITIALAVNILEIDKINDLLKKKIKLNIVLDSTKTAEFMNRKLDSKVSVFLKIDTGYNRTGIHSDDSSSIESSVRIISGSEKLNFAGFLSHSGHSYQTRSKEAIRNIYDDTVKKLIVLKRKYKPEFSDLIISIGDTPTISIAEDLSGVDEIRPGNFVFYDLMQLSLGSCRFDQIAVVLGVPVISKNRERKEVVVHGGAVHLSKEYLRNPSNVIHYGRVVDLLPEGWGEFPGDSYVKSVSQEHSILSATDDLFDSVSIGDVVGIVPVHSCLTANLSGSYITTGGEIILKSRS